MAISLIERLRQTVLDELRAVQPTNKWKVLVLDRHSRKFLTDLLDLDKLYDENVTDVQMIEDVREPNDTFESVYLLMARPQTIKCLIHDLRSPIRLNKTSHIFFLNGLDQMMFEAVQTFRERITACRELFIDFEPRESQVFTTSTLDAPYILYNQRCGDLVQNLISETAQRIVCVCATLGEYPIVRYYRPRDCQHPARVLAEKLAKQVQHELDEYARGNEDFPPQSSRPQGVLLITDRCVDLQAPLLHEFTYQAMVNDLLPIRDGKFYEFAITNSKGAETMKETISEADNVWTSVRHMHMSIAIDKLVQDFNRFTADNAAFADDGKGATTNLNTIRNMLAGMDSYASGKDKYSLYITMAQECMQLFESRQMPLTGIIEQNCATGRTAEGKNVRGLLEAMLPLLDDQNISGEDRARMLLTYVIYKWGLFPDDRRKLSTHAQLPSKFRAALDNLDLVGVPPSRDPRGRASRKAAQAAQFQQQAGSRRSSVDEQEAAFELSRYEPAIKTAVRELVRGGLSNELWPYVKDGPNSPTAQLNGSASMLASHSAAGARPGAIGLASHSGSLRTNRPAWAKGRSMTETPKQRIIVFVAGGATYSEVRSVYELSRETNRDVYLGATNVVTPGEWLGVLSGLRDQREELQLEVDQPAQRVPLLESRPQAQPRTASREQTPQSKSQLRSASGHVVAQAQQSPARIASGSSTTMQQSPQQQSAAPQASDKDGKGKKKVFGGLFKKK
ncbi:hypothetical protein PYCC9005_003734 [Savitreella phatthalungensis]